MNLDPQRICKVVHFGWMCSWHASASEESWDEVLVLKAPADMSQLHTDNLKGTFKLPDDKLVLLSKPEDPFVAATEHTIQMLRVSNANQCYLKTI